MTRDRLRHHGEKVADRVSDYSSVLRHVPAILEKFSHKLDDFKDSEGDSLLTAQLLFNNLRDLTEALNSTHLFEFSQIRGDTSLTLTNARKYITAIIRFVNVETRATGQLSLYCDKLYKALFNKNAFELIIPFDPGFKRRLSAHFKYDFKVTNIVITTKHPSSWSTMDGEDSGTCGWCYNDGKTELWINANYMLSRWSFLRDVSTRSKGYVLNRETSFIKTVVHECRHLMDFQSGSAKYEYKDGNTNIPYQHRIHESTARANSASYEITDEDRRWAKSIFEKVKAAKAEADAKAKEEDND